MCGIAGLVNCGNKKILEHITDLLAHRGPDDSGSVWFDEHHTGLGHRRLSIIDLSDAGHQPMHNGDGSLWITYNGELYNYQEIRAEPVGVNFHVKSRREYLEVIRAEHDVLTYGWR